MQLPSVVSAVHAACLLAVQLAGQSTPDTGFSDAHVHLNNPAEWVELMNANGIQRAVVLRGRAMDHDGLVAASLDWPGRLYPFVSISPEHREYRGSWESDSGEIVALADSLLSTGLFYGVGEISAVHFPGPGFPEADYSPTGAVMHGIFETARRHDVPVMVHIEVTRLAELERMLAEYRDVEVVWAHGGYTQLFLAERMLTRHPNLTYELSARTWRRHPRSPDYTILRDGAEVWGEWLSLIERMPDRFLVGTDASLRSAASDQEKIGSVENLLSQLTEGTRRSVAFGNLERLLHVPN